MTEQETTRRLARLHLNIAHELYQLRIASQREVEDVAEAAGLRVERLEMIEEGDTTSIEEVVRLCAVYQVSLEINAEFEIAIRKNHLSPGSATTPSFQRHSVMSGF